MRLKDGYYKAKNDYECCHCRKLLPKGEQYYARYGWQNSIHHYCNEKCLIKYNIDCNEKGIKERQRIIDRLKHKLKELNDE